ncbi:MAG: hypothetical protein K9L22_11700 [Methylococcaceae bacterium]|nr:hypothetical protein [Methylococcaceae bacterium]
MPKNNYISYLKKGLNKVTGQAFLRQKGGDIVTCAGEIVTLHPNTDYFNYVYSISEHYIKHKQFENEASLVKQTKCDAQGDFEFYNVPEGEWVIKTTVQWEIFWVNDVYSPPINVGDFHLPSSHNTYSMNSQQGGVLALDVVVKDDEPNKFIITE